MKWGFIVLIFLLAQGQSPGEDSVPLNQPQDSQRKHYIIALVNDEIVSSYDVEQRLKLLLFLSDIEQTQEILDIMQQRALEALLYERLYLQEAKHLFGKDFHVADTEIEGAIKNWAVQRSFVTQGEENTYEALENQGLPVAALQAQMQAELSWQYVQYHAISRFQKVSEEEITEWEKVVHEKQKAGLFDIGEIFIPLADPAYTKEVIDFIEQIVAIIKVEPEKFPTFARQFSRAPSASVGGRLGLLSLDALSQHASDVVENMKINEVRYLRLQDGFYILKLYEKQPAHQLFFSLLTVQAENTIDAKLKNNILKDLKNCRMPDLPHLNTTRENVSLEDLTLEQREFFQSYPAGTPLEEHNTQQGVIFLLALCQTSDPVLRQNIKNRIISQKTLTESALYVQNLYRKATILLKDLPSSP